MFKNIFSEEKLNKRFFMIYTMIFVFMSLGVFSVFFITGRTFIWGQDGWEQHIKALIYYSDYLKDFFNNLIVNNKLVVKQWDFAIGEGSDVLGTFHYYVVGDPFAFFCFLFPAKYMFVFYELMIILRIYCAGLAFSAFCKYMGHKPVYILPGTLAYTFSYWAMYNAVRHPFFLNPIVYFPLIILGVEKIIKKDRPYVFIASVAISAISNFYFFYMLVLSTVLYVVIRLVVIYGKDVKSWFKVIFKLGYTAIIGTLISCIVFMPMVYFFTSDSRFKSVNTIRWFYPASYYLKLPGLFTIEGDSYWTCMGFAMPIIFAVILLFMKKKANNSEKIMFVVCVIMTLIPAFGQAFNGMSYMCNRWTFAYSMLVSYILVKECKELTNLSAFKIKVLGASLTAYFVICMIFKYSRNIKLITVVVIAAICLAFLAKCKSTSVKMFIITLSVIMSTLSNSILKYSSFGDNYAASCKTIEEAMNCYSSETELVKTVWANDEGYSEDGFVRYSGEGLEYNASTLDGLSSTGLYWTLTNNFVAGFRKSMGMPLETILPHKFMGYDGRSVMLSLASVRYYVAPREAKDIPYGFRYVSSNDDYKIYENTNALSLGYTYDSTIDYSQWEQLTLTKKQEILLNHMVVRDKNNSDIANVEYASKTLKYTVECEEKEITVEGNSFVVMKPGASVTLYFDGDRQTETYLNFTGFNYDGASEYELYHGAKKYDPKDCYSKEDWDNLSREEQRRIFNNYIYWTQSTSNVILNFKTLDSEKNAYYFTSDYSYYSDQHDFSYNLGYNTNGIKSVTITFNKIGVYSFDTFEVSEYPVEKLDEKLESLSEDSLEEVKVGTNVVNGHISCNKDEYLLVAIPYSKGWKMKVDGKQVDCFEANGMYIGVKLDAGEHDIELKYSTPLLKEGAFVSLLGVILFIVYIFIYERRKNNVQRSC